VNVGRGGETLNTGRNNNKKQYQLWIRIKSTYTPNVEIFGKLYCVYEIGIQVFCEKFKSLKIMNYKIYFVKN